LFNNRICEVKPCSFNGVYQPSLLSTFPTGNVLLLSYFYDRLSPLIPSHSTQKITVSTFAELARDVCPGPSSASWESRWRHDQNAMEELEGRPEYCLDLTFMYALLRLGYEFDDGREVQLEKKIGGTELGWCLGAVLELVGAGEVTCRV
jgi:guanosine-diphosphatase